MAINVTDDVILKMARAMSRRNFQESGGDVKDGAAVNAFFQKNRAHFMMLSRAGLNALSR